MFPFRSDKKQLAADLSTVVSQRLDLIPEEFPEGPYGSYGSKLLVESSGESFPWEDDQRSPNRFGYENRELHAGMPRDYPGDDETDITSEGE
jgi:hypothetical protein